MYILIRNLSTYAFLHTEIYHVACFRPIKSKRGLQLSPDSCTLQLGAVRRATIFATVSPHIYDMREREREREISFISSSRRQHNNIQ